MKIGSKGQVVIPKQLRDDIGIMPNDIIEFDKIEDYIIIKKPQEKDPLKVFIEIKKLMKRKFTIKDFKKINWNRLYDEEMEERFKNE